MEEAKHEENMNTGGSAASTQHSEHKSAGKDGAQKTDYKKYFVIGMLVLIVLVGAYFRFYHADYPVIGYHNWKETHYLTEARNFEREGFFAHGFFVPEWDYPDMGNTTNQQGVHSDTFPTISILGALAFKIFGESLLAARMIGILCVLGSVVLMFLITRKMFGRDDMALAAAALTALMPLLVFFSHNFDLINPGLLFMLLSWYFFLGWRETFSFKHGALTVLFLTLSGMTKYPFLIIALPMLATIPWKKLLSDIKPNWKNYLTYVLLAVPLPAWFIYSKVIENITGITSTPEGIVDLTAIFKLQWWSVMKSYCADNYTLIGLFIAFVGLVLLYLLGKDHFGNKFTLYYAGASVPWLIIMSSKLSSHSYHQYPIAPLIIILMSYAFVALGTNIGNMLSKDLEKEHIKYIVLLIVLLIMLVPFGKAIDRQFDTQFVGLDVAGEYIKEHSEPGDRIIFPRGQSFGVLWHADRKGYGIQQPTKAQIIEAEGKGVKWLFLYQWGLSVLNDKDAWDYLNNNYGIMQVGFTRQNNQPQLIYILLQKGGKSSEAELNNFLANHKEEKRSYMFSGGGSELSYASVDN